MSFSVDPKARYTNGMLSANGLVEAYLIRAPNGQPYINVRCWSDGEGATPQEAINHLETVHGMSHQEAMSEVISLVEAYVGTAFENIPSHADRGG